MCLMWPTLITHVNGSALTLRSMTTKAKKNPFERLPLCDPFNGLASLRCMAARANNKKKNKKTTKKRLLLTNHRMFFLFVFVWLLFVCLLLNSFTVLFLMWPTSTVGQTVSLHCRICPPVPEIIIIKIIVIKLPTASSHKPLHRFDCSFTGMFKFDPLQVFLKLFHCKICPKVPQPQVSDIGHYDPLFL